MASAAFTMPTVMQNFTTAHIKVVPVQGLEPADVLLAWRRDRSNPLLRSLIRASQEFAPPAGL